MSTERPEWSHVTMVDGEGRLCRPASNGTAIRLRAIDRRVPETYVPLTRTLSLLESDEVVEAVAAKARGAEWRVMGHRERAELALQAAKHAIQKQLEEDGDGA